MNTTTTINVLVIAPGERPRRASIENTLEAKQSIVGGYIEPVDLDERDAISCYANEEGKLQGLPLNRSIRRQRDTAAGPAGEILDIIAGTFLIAGYDPETGEDISLTDEQAEHYANRFHDPEVVYRTPSGRIGTIPVHVF